MENTCVRILFLLNAYEDDGPGRLIHSVVGKLIHYEGVECWTAALRRSGPMKEKFDSLLVPTKVIKMRYIYQLNEFKSLVEFIKSNKFDIVHTNLVRADIIGRQAAKKAGVPVIVTTEHGIHTWQVRGKLVEYIVKYLYKRTAEFTDCIIAVSDYVKERLIEAGIPPEKIVRIYNGIDIQEFAPVSEEERREFRRYLSEDESYHIVGGVGNLVSLKGHSYFIRAIPQILEKHPKTLFVIVGEGPLHKHLVAEVNRLGLSGKVRFLGRLSTLTARVISSMDVLVQPSLTESFGLVVAEALGCGVPVVGTQVGGVPEIVVDGQHGFLVEPMNPDAIADKVIWLLDHKEEARAIAERGRQYVGEHFDIRKTVQEYYDLYTRLFQAKG